MLYGWYGKQLVQIFEFLLEEGCRAGFYVYLLPKNFLHNIHITIYMGEVIQGVRWD